MRRVSVLPRRTVSESYRVGWFPGSATPIHHGPGSSESVMAGLAAGSRRTRRPPASATGISRALGAGRGDRATSAVSRVRSSVARDRTASRIVRIESAIVVRRRISAYRRAYAGVRLSAVSSARTSVFRESRRRWKRPSNVVALSSRTRSRARLSGGAPFRVAAMDTRDGLIGSATTSTLPRDMVESITTTTSPDPEHPSAMTASIAVAAPRAARGRI